MTDTSNPTYKYGHPLAADFAEHDTECKVGLIMGSRSDWPFIQPCADMLEQLQIPFEFGVVSAHRTPERMTAYAQQAVGRGLSVIIACAGGSAHLPGMVASETLLPVIGVAPKKPPEGIDAMWSMVRMPAGKPLLFAGFGDAGAKNAALSAGAILAQSDLDLTDRLDQYHGNLRDEVPHTCF